MLTRPFKFAPYLKTVIWGGNRIAPYEGIDTDLRNIGESWEISAVPGHESMVIDNPEHEGLSLVDLIEKYGADFLGEDVMARWGKEFPLLIKIIDAANDLSVQVHPDDVLAHQRHGCNGKTEMWYIIEAEPDANIYTGLSKPFSPEEYVRKIEDNTIMEVVGKHHSEPDQFYFVPAGTLHAIGAGNLLAEVQQSSDVTYRVYDYDRRDANGNPRELHTELAKDAIDYRYPNDINPTAKVYDHTTEGAVTSDYFKVDFLKIDADETFEIRTDRKSFAILMVTSGEFDVRFADGHVESYPQGVTLLFPASMAPSTLYGHAKGLLIKC